MTISDETPRRERADIDGLPAWTRLVASLFFATLGGAGMWAPVVVLPDMQREFLLDRGMASLAYTATMVGFALGNVLVGRLIDRFGFARPAFIATLLMGAGFILVAVAPSFPIVIASQALLIGTGASVSFGPLLADISHWFERRRGLAVTIVASGNYLAGAAWPLAIRAVLPHFGWRGTYIAIGIVCLVGMSALLLRLRGRPQAEPGIGISTSKRAAANAAISLSPRTLQTLLMLAGIGCCTAMATPQVHIVALSNDLGYGIANGANMLSVMLGAGIFSRILSGYVADRIGGIRTLLAGSVLQCISLLLFIPTTGLVPLYLISLIFGLAQGGIVPCYAIIVREFMPAAEAGRRVGIVIMATISGMALGGWLSGYLRDMTGTYSAAFGNAVAWNVMNMAIISYLLWRSSRRDTGPAVGAIGL